MLTIGKVGRGNSAKEYYLDLHEESSYYQQKASGEPPGQWHGGLCENFGLSGAVGMVEFCKLLHAESPKDGEQLRQWRPNGRPAFDLTFSAPKSVSVVHALAKDQETKQAIEAAMYEAVKEGFRHIEEEACYTRLGKNGIEDVRGEGLVAALFLHTTSREHDPQFHMHAVTFNFTEGPDGKYRALEASKIYEHKCAAGALFRVELARRLMALGYEIERDGFSFSIKGVPTELCDEFSKRSKQIQRELGEKEGTPEQKNLANLKTRQSKCYVDPEKLQAEQQRVANAHGFTAERVEELKTGVKAEDWDEAAELWGAVREALNEITSSQSSFTHLEFLEQAAIQGQTRGVSAKQIELQVWGVLRLAMEQKELDPERRQKLNAPVVSLGQHRDGNERFTTKELYEFEQQILQAVERARRLREHCVSDTTLAEAYSSKPTLKTEQKEAAKHITQGEGLALCVSGRAGTGKTYMLDAARLALEAEGFRVLGCALSGKAAEELSKGANIESVTIAKLIYDLDHPGRKDRLTLDSKTVLIVDEAGMVGTRALHRLVMEAEQAGARLVLVGDENQLQSIDAGGGFAGLSKRLGYAELKEITRQRRPEDRQAVYDMADGNAAPALKSYAERNRLTLGEDWADTMQKLVADWQRDKTELKEKLILSSTNRQAATINGLCQEVRQRHGELGEASITVHDGAEVHVGDRVLFTRNDKRFGVHNGDLATVVKVTAGTENEPRAKARMLVRRAGANQAAKMGETLTVKLDSGKVLAVPLSNSKSWAEYDANDIRLGYCVTTHKAQGATVENAYVFAHGFMTSAEMAYVQVSRARNDTRIYATKDEAGPELSDLAKAMSRSSKKTMAHDVTDEGAAFTSTSTSMSKPRRGLRHEFSLIES